MLSDPCGKQAFIDGITMHVVTVAQLMEEAMPHLSKHKVPSLHAILLWTLSTCHSAALYGWVPQGCIAERAVVAALCLLELISSIQKCAVESCVNPKASQITSCCLHCMRLFAL